jgi:hypothetical protein
MKPLLIICVSAACALAACSNGQGGTAGMSFDPFGTEPASGTDTDRPPVTGTVAQLCAYDCMRFESACPGGGPGSGSVDCISSCTSSAMSIPNCTAQFRNYLACLATAPVSCTNGSLTINGCEAASQAISNCANGLATPSNQ